MPPSIEKKAPTSYISDVAMPVIEPQPVNVIDVETAQQMANDAASRAALEAANIAADRVAKAANEAATRTLSGFKDSNNYEEVSLDREMKKLFYHKMTKPSFGEVLAEQIDNKLAGELVGKLIPGLFSPPQQVQSPSTGSKAGSFILEVLNTQFAYGAGQTLGNSVPEIIKTIGKDRIEQFIDAYQRGGLNPEEQMIMQEQQRMAEEQQLQQQQIIEQQMQQQMAEQQMHQQMQQQMAEQQMADQQMAEQQQRGRNHPPSRGKDLNRELIQQYESGKGGNEGAGGGGGAGGAGGLSGGFFDEVSQPNFPPQPGFSQQGFPPQPNFSIVGGIFGTASLKEDEFILSLNSDDPISQQQYMSFRGIAGVPFDMVKKMMIKEQNTFRELPPANQRIIDVPSAPSSGDSWNENDINKRPPATELPIQDAEVKVMKKKDFYKEIGLKTKEELEQEQKLQDTTPKPEKIELKEEHQEQVVQDTPNVNNVNTPIPNMDVVVGAIERIGKSFEAGLTALTGRMEIIENEFISVKSQDKQKQDIDIEKIGKSINNNLDTLNQKIKLLENDLKLIKSKQAVQQNILRKRMLPVESPSTDKSPTEPVYVPLLKQTNQQDITKNSRPNVEENTQPNVEENTQLNVEHSEQVIEHSEQVIEHLQEPIVAERTTFEHLTSEHEKTITGLAVKPTAEPTVENKTEENTIDIIPEQISVSDETQATRPTENAEEAIQTKDDLQSSNSEPLPADENVKNDTPDNEKLNKIFRQKFKIRKKY